MSRLAVLLAAVALSVDAARLPRYGKNDNYQTVEAVPVQVVTAQPVPVVTAAPVDNYDNDDDDKKDGYNMHARPVPVLVQVQEPAMPLPMETAVVEPVPQVPATAPPGQCCPCPPGQAQRPTVTVTVTRTARPTATPTASPTANATAGAQPTGFLGLQPFQPPLTQGQQFVPPTVGTGAGLVNPGAGVVSQSGFGAPVGSQPFSFGTQPRMLSMRITKSVAPQQQGFIGQPSTFQQQPATLTTQQQGFIQPASFAQPGLLQQPLLNQPL